MFKVGNGTFSPNWYLIPLKSNTLWILSSAVSNWCIVIFIVKNKISSYIQ